MSPLQSTIALIGLALSLMCLGYQGSRDYREPSKALAAWWLLCGRTAEALDETHTKQSISNRILLELNMVETLALVGGEHRIPMSLTDFDEEQLWRLVEAGKNFVQNVLIRGVDIDALMKSRRSA